MNLGRNHGAALGAFVAGFVGAEVVAAVGAEALAEVAEAAAENQKWKPGQQRNADPVRHQKEVRIDEADLGENPFVDS
jgi:hypothetical protein